MLLSGEIKLRVIGDFSKRAGKFHPWPMRLLQIWTAKKACFSPAFGYSL
jgi:hypothetical protein